MRLDSRKVFRATDLRTKHFEHIHLFFNNSFLNYKLSLKLAKIKFKYASLIWISAYFFINIYCIVTRTLKINLELNNKFLNSEENFRKKNRTLNNLNVNFWNIKINIKYLKVWCKLQKWSSNTLHKYVYQPIFYKNVCIVTRTL